jgi:hypothetical protein
MDTRLSFSAGLVIVLTLFAAPLAHADELECGFDESLFAGAMADTSCTSPQMTMAIVWTTHNRIMQAPSSPWPDSTYLTGMLEMETEFENYVNFVSGGRTQMDVRVIKRRGADSVYAWVVVDSLGSAIRSSIAAKINGGQASSQDSTFFKSADGVFFYQGRTTDDPWYPGGMFARFCQDQGLAYANVGVIHPDGKYLLVKLHPSTYRHFWRMVTVHEVGHMFGLNHAPNSGNGSENVSCVGCLACFNAMDGYLSIGCVDTQHQYIPYHGLHLQRLGWADFVSIPRDTTLYVRDFRVRPTIYKIQPVSNRKDIFSLYNLQRTGLDSVIAGEGLAITHARDILDNGWDTGDIWDIEVPSPMYTVGTSRCPALPHVEDPLNGVDTLQCRRGGDEIHLWPNPENDLVHFATGTNPWTKLYVTNASAPYDSQSVNAWLCLTTESLADSFISGKEMVKVVVNINCGNENEGPEGAPMIGEGIVEQEGLYLHASVVAHAEGADFILEGSGVRSLDRLEIYALTGRVVRSIQLRGAFGRGNAGRVSWDGHDSRGQRIASGVYFYRLLQATGEVSASGRVVIVR